MLFDYAIPAMPEPPFEGAILLEPHAHTAEISHCSSLPADALVELVAQHGYGAVVITDHNLSGRTKTAAQCAAFMRGFQLAKAAGEKRGIAVLPGMELRFASEGENDFLVFLPDLECYELRNLPAMSPRDFKALADERGMLIYQAHPFRSYTYPLPPEVLHGVEVYNGNPNHRHDHDRALDYARKHGLSMLASSDLHDRDGVRRGGIWVPREAIASPRAFVQYLRETPQPEMFRPL